MGVGVARCAGVAGGRRPVGPVGFHAGVGARVPERFCASFDEFIRRGFFPCEKNDLFVSGFFKVFEDEAGCNVFVDVDRIRATTREIARDDADGDFGAELEKLVRGKRGGYEDNATDA